jgi:hypothetical protein
LKTHTDTHARANESCEARGRVKLKKLR